MIKYKNRIIAGVIIAAVLAFAYWWGGDAPSLHARSTQESQPATLTESKEKPKALHTESPDVATTNSPKTAPKETAKASDAAKENSSQNTDNTSITPEEKEERVWSITFEGSSENYEEDKEYSQNSGMDINEDTGKDKYQTNPVPEGKPVPIEPQDAVISDKELSCTLSIRCDTILSNISRLDDEKVSLVPKNGVIFAEKTVTFYEGESVFNLLLRETKKNKIHMEFENTPIFNSAYIEGIGNLYEYDCGELSGWMYKVNDWYPNYGCSRYQLKAGDKVEWVYTCDLGADVGGYYGAKNGMR